MGSRALLLMALALLLFAAGTARAASPMDGWHNFGLGTGDECFTQVAIDGHYAAVDDEMTGELYYCDMATGQAHDTGVSRGAGGQAGLLMLSGQRIAYFDQGVSAADGTRFGIWVCDVPTGRLLDTHIRTAALGAVRLNAGRWFDGARICYRDMESGHIKLYYLADGTTRDTGIDGYLPNISGDLMSYEVHGDETSATARRVGLYTISTGGSRDLGPGRDPHLAGSVVSYWSAPDAETWNGELCYYRADTDSHVSTGLVGNGAQSTDGVSIAVAPEFASVKIVDVATGTVRDTGLYACDVSASCWITVSGTYLAFERYEMGAYVNGEQLYPATDFNGDGVADGACAAVWYQIGPGASLAQLVQQVTDLNLSHGIANSLDAKLQAAQQALSDINQHNDAAAIATLQSFIDAVRMQSGSQIPTAEADALIASAQDILDWIAGR